MKLKTRIQVAAKYYGAAGMFFILIGTSQAMGQGLLVLDGLNDTVEVDGQTVLGNTGTLEFRILFREDAVCGDSGSRVFWELTPGVENKTMLYRLDPDCRVSIGGQMFPAGGSSALEAPVATSPSCWDHVAFVYDGVEQRLYLNGQLVVSRPATGPAASGSNKGHIGAMDFDGGLREASQGYVDFIRISGVARYSGSSFEPPTSDPTPDADTLLLFNFDDAPGSTTITDESGNNRTGHFGIGFPGATSPELITSLPADVVCGATVPTVSDWGVVTMTLLLLAAGTVVFMKRRPLAA